MKLYCTRPGCTGAERNNFTDLEDLSILKTVQQKYCATCGMPLILDNRYLPERLLEKGGFGAAFLARDRRSPTLKYCVVKQFQPSRDLDPQQLATAQGLFEREAHVLERLGNEHPQIPDLFAYFPLEVSGWRSPKSQQFFYIVQEYIDGETLESELATKGQLSEAEVREVLQEILKILQFIHDQDVIHRDIKPSNIIRDRHNQFYLLDFGAVKQVTQNAGQTSTGIYSLGFAPPEQMRGYSVFPSTDLYALAVTCLVLLTGKEPQDLYNSYTDQWQWKQFVQVSESLAGIFDKMLLPTPSDRFGSAAQILTALNPPTQLQPTPSAPVVVSSPFPTLKVLLGAGFTGFEAGCLGIILYSLTKSQLLVLGIGMLLLSSLVLAQTRRWIENFDLVVISGISLALLWFFPFFRAGLSVKIIIVPIALGLVCIAATALFRLVYLLLSRIL